jgi:hypothetical protein
MQKNRRSIKQRERSRQTDGKEEDDTMEKKQTIRWKRSRQTDGKEEDK